MRLYWALAVGFVLQMTGAPLAADMQQASNFGRCNANWSAIEQLPKSVIQQSVASHFAEATAATTEWSVVASSRPAFTWAVQTRIACGQALGYLNNNYIDIDAVQKCECFHDRFVSYR